MLRCRETYIHIYIIHTHIYIYILYAIYVCIYLCLYIHVYIHVYINMGGCLAPLPSSAFYPILRCSPFH
jgi:hypothetical protein